MTFATKSFRLSGFFFAVVIILIIIKIVKILWNRRHLYRLSYQCDGPFSWPIVGNLFDFGTTGESE